MKKTTDNHKQKSNPVVAAVMDALRTTPLHIPQTRKALREIVRDLARHEAQFDAQMKKVEEELARGCRRTKGDIV